MKRTLGILITLAFVGSICFAQEAAKTQPAPVKSSPVMPAAKTIIGKVASVTTADPAKGIMNGAISVVDTTGRTIVLTVSSVSKILDAASNIIPLNQLKEGDDVRVKESKTAAGEKEVQSITLLK